ncbi:MAG: ATP-binding protein [Lachnospiraceae bacterium]|nr:ATP-binding protein [Lachnospiraceae bacterium]
MKIIGREREKDLIKRCVESKRPEFVAVYGRRRVGKTYLIKEYFNKQFSFYATGLTDEKKEGQLRAFNQSLVEYGSTEAGIPTDWFEAFTRLKKLLLSENVYREPSNGKIVVFLDELPWMDTQKSDFKSALDYFWNSWGSSKEDLLLIICGSATSWIINNILMNRKGFHNRVTRRIQLLPFSLRECEQLLEYNDAVLPRDQLMESYMIFGGIPFYLNLLDSHLSLAQNVDELIFKPYGELYSEYDNLFYSLFKKPEKHLAIVKALSNSKMGMTRKALTEIEEIGGGSMLTKNLMELEQCGFIRRYMDDTKVEKNSYYQLVDPFTLFSLRFAGKRKTDTWAGFIKTPGYYSWRGNAFELLCFNHIPQIKYKLGISGVDTSEYGFRFSSEEGGAQIDLCLDRKDGVINLCEDKYTTDPYEVNEDDYTKLQHRAEVFRKKTKTRKGIHLTLITANGLKKGKYSGVFQHVITGDDLFNPE